LELNFLLGKEKLQVKKISNKIINSVAWLTSISTTLGGHYDMGVFGAVLNYVTTSKVGLVPIAVGTGLMTVHWLFSLMDLTLGEAIDKLLEGTPFGDFSFVDFKNNQMNKMADTISRNDILSKIIKPEYFQQKQQTASINVKPLLDLFEEMKINANVIDIEDNEYMTRFHIDLYGGTQASRIRTIEEDIAIKLGKLITIPENTNEGLVIEAHKKQDKTNILHADFVFDTVDFGQYPLGTIALGINKSNREMMFYNITEECHCMICGKNKSGKSRFLDMILLSLIKHPAATPDTLNFIFIAGSDKTGDLGQYNNLAFNRFHQVAGNIENIEKSIKWIQNENEHRKSILSDANVRDMDAYNAMNPECQFPRIIFMVDEFANMLNKYPELEDTFVYFSNETRAQNINMILVSQSAKANEFPTSISKNFKGFCFSVKTYQESRNVIGFKGAEKILTKGTFMCELDGELLTIQAPLCSDELIDNTIKKYRITPSQSEKDELVYDNVIRLKDKNNYTSANLKKINYYRETIEVFIDDDYISANKIARYFHIGKDKAEEIIKYFIKSDPKMSLIEPTNDKNKPYRWLITRDEWNKFKTTIDQRHGRTR